MPLLNPRQVGLGTRSIGGRCLGLDIRTDQAGGYGVLRKPALNSEEVPCCNLLLTFSDSGSGTESPVSRMLFLCFCCRFFSGLGYFACLSHEAECLKSNELLPGNSL
ncbi:hypothetical protein D3C87_1599530 [compost metagenome]